MKKCHCVIASILSVIVTSNVYADATCANTVYSNNINQYQNELVGARYEQQILNNTALNQNYMVDETVCISNTTCNKSHVERFLKPGQSLYYQDQLQVNKIMDQKGTYEVESTLSIKGTTDSGCSLKNINHFTVS